MRFMRKMNLKVTVASNKGTAKTSAMGTGKIDRGFGCFYFCILFNTGLIDALISVYFKCICCFTCQGTPSSSILCACWGQFPAWAILTFMQPLKRFNGLSCFHFPFISDSVFQDHGFNVGGLWAVQDLKVCDSSRNQNGIVPMTMV